MVVISIWQWGLVAPEAPDFVQFCWMELILRKVEDDLLLAFEDVTLSVIGYGISETKWDRVLCITECDRHSSLYSVHCFHEFLYVAISIVTTLA